ncbi:hypothetical protein ACRAWD_02390 [Caulobacter segnis]
MARAHDPRIVRVDANVRATDTTVLIAEADGLLAGDVRPMTILSMGGDRRAGRPARARQAAGWVGARGWTAFRRKRSRRWSRPPSRCRSTISTPSPRRWARCRSCWDPAIRAYCSMRRWGTGLRAIITASICRPSTARSGSGSLRPA